MPHKRLLVLEDDVQVALLVAQIAAEAGYNTSVLTNTFDIEVHLQALHPDVIVLDIIMPENNGFDVINYLNQIGLSAKLVILSGSNYAQMAEKLAVARGLDVVAVIMKPFQNTELRAILQEACGGLPGASISSTQALAL